MRHGAHRSFIDRPAARNARAAPSRVLAHLARALRNGLAVHPQLQLLTHLEERHALGGDRHDRTRFRIAPLARLALLHDEAAEAADLDALATRQRLGHAVEHRVDDDFRIPSREAWI